MKKLTILLTLLGLAVITAATAWSGFGSVADAVMRIGAGGFIITVLAQVGVDLVLGAAWHAAFPAMSFLHLFKARLVRDSAATCLPFSQLGGIVLGIRATCRHHGVHGNDEGPVEWPEAACANVVDITTEVLGQIVFILLSVTLLAIGAGSNPLVKPVIIGALLLAIGIAGFIWTQQRGGTAVKRTVRFLGQHIAGQWQATMLDGASTLQTLMDDAWSHPGRISASAAIHFAGWVSSAGLLWLTVLLLGSHLSFLDAIAIEGVTCGLLSASFLVPAGLGVLEGAYMALAHSFGLPSSVGLALALLRRGREFSIGIPVLLLWQASEMRSLRARTNAASDAVTDQPNPVRVEEAPHG
ncbi:lysylphosphatidylglycerol synthase domain-containing protein [Acetobacter fallax]|uniref:HpnL family protein n=1 Tax=Acetobacter fallax TaxID=1737473 RepID=A0ABX0KAV7_9PROT|nr:lysylphosphatidylglycerol synthase domain-containing protein [Acetobacter fallax]NHO32564.1 HpnL family protein [Acetobacter fallax]NHO36091.1 HpnL family protein [Acetobacter fallax]